MSYLFDSFAFLGDWSTLYTFPGCGHNLVEFFVQKNERRTILTMFMGVLPLIYCGFAAKTLLIL
jgi:hypothetical protein